MSMNVYEVDETIYVSERDETYVCYLACYLTSCQTVDKITYVRGV